MPVTFGSLPFDVLCFASGMLAKRNRWLDGDSGMAISSREVLSAKVLSVLMTSLIIGVKIGFYIVESPLGSAIGLPTQNCTTRSDITADVASPDIDSLAGVVLLQATVLGMGCFASMVSIIDIFQMRLSFQSDWTQFFGPAAYAVYLIHPLIVVLCTRLYVVVLEAADNSVQVYFEKGSNLSHSCLGTASP